MPVVKINALAVPPQAHAELEKRFAARADSMTGTPGFLGFQLLRPVSGETRYFVVTQWEDDASFEAWRSGPADQAHAPGPATDRPAARSPPAPTCWSSRSSSTSAPPDRSPAERSAGMLLTVATTPTDITRAQ